LVKAVTTVGKEKRKIDTWHELKIMYIHRDDIKHLLMSETNTVLIKKSWIHSLDMFIQRLMWQFIFHCLNIIGWFSCRLKILLSFLVDAFGPFWTSYSLRNYAFDSFGMFKLFHLWSSFCSSICCWCIWSSWNILL
jgi:hypothetical protein